MPDMSIRLIEKSINQVTCIVVDDDICTTDVFAEYLSLKEINVIGKSYDAESAIRMFEQKRPDIVFLDVMMEPKDGCYALDHIKRIDPNAIVIMVTADLRKETEEQLEKLNASAIVYKPFNIGQIMETLSSFVADLQEVKPLCMS